MNDIILQIRKRAKDKGKTIIMPESGDPRVLKAGSYLAKENICKVSLVGEKDSIAKIADKKGVTLSENITFQSLHTVNYAEELVTYLYNRRQHKGLSRKEASEILQDSLYFGAGTVALDKADGCVAGSVATTGEVIRAAIQSIGLRKGIDTVSSTFLMAFKNNNVFTYADCGVVPYPDTEQLADIAIESARTHHLLTQEEPVVALLSFSTKGSARHDRTELVTKALSLARDKEPELRIDGELQFDAAFVPEVAKRKAPGSNVAGQANVFIFPNLDAGNISYKITERLAGASATGPILQGLDKPMMDLSRGCNWQDIVNAACVAVLMSED